MEYKLIYSQSQERISALVSPSSRTLIITPVERPSSFAHLKLMSYNCRFRCQDASLLTLSLVPPYEIIIRELGKYCDLIGISNCVCPSVCLYIAFSVQTLVTCAPANQSFHPPPHSKVPSTPANAGIVHRSTNTHSIKRIACLGLIAIFTEVVMIIVNNLIKTSSSHRKAGLQSQA